MLKKYLPLFASFLVLTFLTVLFHPQRSLGANDHVVISQIQVGGIIADDEFVELFNPTGGPIDLTGYKLTKKVSVTGNQSTLIASMSGVINANSYLLLAHTGYDGSPVEDKTYTTSNVTANNTVILYSDNGTTVVDKAGFGASYGTEYETSPFPTNPPTDGSIQRINNADTDNNSLDFAILQTSNPRNSSSVVATATPSASSSSTSTPVPTATSVANESPTPTATPLATEVPTTPTESPTVVPTESPSSTPIHTSKPNHGHDNEDDDDHDFDLPFGFRCRVERRDFRFRNFHFKHYRLHFGRR